MPGILSRLTASLANAFNKTLLALTFIVILGNVYRRLVLDTADPYKCSALVHEGQWLDSPERSPESRPFQTWQPPGCILHEYQQADIAACHEDGNILFVGDTGTRQLFWAAARKIEGNTKWVFNEKLKPDEHRDIAYQAEGVRLRFLWDPWLNSSALQEELKAFKSPNSRPQGSVDGETGKNNAKPQKPVAIVIGGGLWYARYYQDAITPFRQSLDSVISSAYGVKSQSITNLSMSPHDGIGDQVFFLPVIEPWYDKLSPSREITIIPDKINAMNDFIETRSRSHGIPVLWSYASMTKGRPETYGESGIHVVDGVSKEIVDVLLNLRCNAKAAQGRGYPFNCTCCSPYRPTKWTQVVGAISILGLSFMMIKGRNAKRRSRSIINERAGTRTSSTSANGSAASTRKKSRISASSLTNPLSAIFVLLFATSYCFLADRTQIFEKANKLFSNFDFRILLIVIVLPCLLNIKATLAPQGRRRLDPSTEISPAAFLPRVQSDEFKGWMQVYILIYNYTGASSVVDFYEVFRIFVALYIFLSGYGHTMYFLKSRDYSMRRIVSVLLRLNTLPVLLSFMMDRPFWSYYFAPLVSFWFLVVYLTLRIGQRFNDSLWILLGKIVISALLVTYFIHVPGILTLIVTILHYVFRTTINTGEWRSYLVTDKYIIFIGMIVAILHINLRSQWHTTPARTGAGPDPMHQFIAFLRPVSVGFALVTLPTFWILTREFGVLDYDEWMPYMAHLPVLSFIILRNATCFLRSHYCASFAWIGQMSLELYILSQHIWLAGDGNGILSAGFRGDGSLLQDRWRNYVSVTVIFVWIAWNSRNATRTLTTWIMGHSSDGKEEDETADVDEYSGTELDILNGANGLPSPASSLDGKRNKRDAKGNQGIPREGKIRLLIIALGIWLASLLS